MRTQIKVLMIEDVETDAELAMRELKRAGIMCSGRRVDTEPDLRSALTACWPDVILSDFSMPHFDGMSGLAISREMCPQTPFIFLSGTIGEEYAIRALKNGASDYVLKSNLVRLPPVVERAIQDAQAQAEQRLAEQLRALEHSMTRSLAYADDAAEALKAAIRSVCEIGKWDCGRYFALDQNTGKLSISEAWGVPDDDIEKFIAMSRSRKYPPGVGLPGHVLQSGEVLWSPNVLNDSRLTQVALERECGIHGSLGFLIVTAGKTIGVLIFSSHQVREREERLLETVGVIGSQIGQLLERLRVVEEQHRFRVALDTSAEIILLADRGTMRHIDLNGTASELLGYSRDEMLKMGPQDILMLDREEIERRFDELIANPASPQANSVISNLRCKDGSWIPVETTRRVVQSGGSQIVVSIARDIRNRIAAEEALKKSNERFNLAVHATKDVIWDWDLVTDELWWNENLARAFGYGKDDIGANAKGWHDLIHPDDRNRVVTALHRMLELGDVDWSDEYRLRRQDGSYAFVYDRGYVERDAAGKARRMIGAKADITARKQAEERLSYLAQFDTLTGLPNRHLFRDRLAQTLVQSRRSRAPVAVMFVDLDRFKLVNDTLGHLAGDKLLNETAARLSSCVRTGDTVGRFGGDEFGILLSDLGRPSDAGHVAQKIIDAVSQPFQLDGHESYVTASVGITLSPVDSEEVDTLIANADTAMYRAKEQGRNNYQFFTREMNERALRRVEMETALRKAVERGEFLLHYQPKVELAGGTICGFEALLRWMHPEKGLVPPVEFVPLLEETGLIVTVGEWVLGESCRQLAAWQKAGLSPPPVAVNLSARQFQEEGLEATLREILGATGIDPSLIQFEITESLLMKDPEGAARTLRGLREAGFRLSVDDFGTGYSSLAYLRRFPIDALKIDRAFVRDVTTSADDATIALAIIGLAHSLKLKVIAEGVETEAQMVFLRDNGCDEIQGFYFARGLNVADSTQALAGSLCLSV